MRGLWAKLRAVGRRDAIARELDDEMQAHLDLIADELISQGVDPTEARRQAARRFGHRPAARRRALEAWELGGLEGVARDVRLGVRGIRRNPAFSATVLLTLALGIGATTSIFSLLWAVRLRPLPYPDPDRLVVVAEAAGEAVGISVTWGNLRHFAEDAHAFEQLAGYVRGVSSTLSGRGEPRVVHGWMVGHGFFELTGWRPAEGRLFVAADDHRGAARTVVLADAFWRKALGGDPAVIGQSLDLDGETYEVVGVLPPGVEFLDADIEFYLPLGLFFTDSEDRGRHGSIRGLARLRPEVTLAEATDELDAVLEALALSDPGAEDEHRAHLTELTRAVTGGVDRALWLLFGAGALVLALACANVASLLLSRGLLRRQELEIRAAIGASRRRLAAQQVTETLVVAGLGGALGVILARLALGVLVRRGAIELPRIRDVRLDIPVLAFATGVTLLVGLLASLAPVFAQRPDRLGSLREGNRTAGGGRAGQTLRGALVVGQVSLTLVLAFAAIVLLRSLHEASRTDPGFETSRLVELELRLPASAYPDAASRRRFYEALTQRLGAQPWVESAAAVGCPPMRGNCGDWWVSIEGRPQPAESEVPVSRFDVAQAGAFRTLGTRLLAGREFTATDGADAPILVVNEAFTRRWWQTPHDALGAWVKVGGPYQPGPRRQIVGVVADARQDGPDEAVEPQFWMPFSADPRAGMVTLIRVRGEEVAAFPALRAIVAELDDQLPIWSVQTFSDAVSQALRERRLGTWLIAAFAALAMALAGVGIYGVLQQWVAARRGEIALRMALGADGSRVVRLVGRHAALLLGLGLGFGTVGASVVSRWLGSVAFAVPALDPLTLLAAGSGVLVVSATVASVPVLRALRVDAGRDLQRS